MEKKDLKLLKKSRNYVKSKYMKIGILTFHASHNCGSMLQAFALQKILETKYGANVEIIDYSNSVSRSIYGLVDYRFKKSAVIRNLKTLKYLSTCMESRKCYNDFSDKYLKKSAKQYKTVNDLEGIEKHYDMLIAGGDQIWNVRCADAGKEYYLNFAQGIKKVAYSPSLGGSNIFKYANNIDDYKRYLLDFSSLSVREPHGKKWLEELTGRQIRIVADPTLLLSPNDWSNFLPIPEVEGEYIFNYAFYHDNDKINKSLQSISEKLNMPVIIMDIKSHAIYGMSKYKINRYINTGPLAFLGLMKNASLVMTQSFHGTLFSALFNRKFWSFNIPEYNNPDDDRATAILEQLGLSERYKMIDELIGIDILDPIDYTKVNVKIDMLRSDAFDYINSFM